MAAMLKRLWSSLSGSEDSPAASDSLAYPQNEAESETNSVGDTEASSKVNGSKFSLPSSPSVIRALAILGGAVLVGVSLWVKQQEWSSRMALLSWGIFSAGLSVIIFSSRIAERGSTPPWLKFLESRLSQWLGVKGWQLLCLLVSPIMALIAAVAAGDGVWMFLLFVAVTAWVSGIVLAVIGGWKTGQTKLSLTRQTLLVFGLISTMAFLIRGYHLSNIPPVLTGDEAGAGLAAVDVVHGMTNNIFRAGWFSFPALHSFLQAVPIASFGQTTQALRLTSVLAGALTVGAVYLFMRELFDERSALFAAVFLATFHFHNHFSRIGLNNIWDGLWLVVVLGFLWHGWQHDSRRSYLLAGLALGLSQYFYVSVRVLFVLIPVWVLLAGFFDRDRLKGSLPNLFAMCLVGIVTFLPLAWYYLRYPEDFLAPLLRVSILGPWMANEVSITGLAPWRIILQQVGLSLEGFAHIPLRMWYQPGTPLLRLLPAVLFFLGLGLLLRRPKDGRALLLGIWLLAFGVMNGFSESAPAAQRYVAVAPAAAILVGYGVAEGSVLLGDLWPGYRGVIGLAAFVLVFLLSLDEVNFYFREYTPKSDLGGDNTLVADRLAKYLQDKADSWKVGLFGSPRMGYYSIASLAYLAPQIEGYDFDAPWGSPENPQLHGQVIFVFLPGHEVDLESIQISYPGGKLLQERTKEGDRLYWLYEVNVGEGIQTDAYKDRPDYPYPMSTPVIELGGYP
jgi:4-amino-4-deoxy-L-arabinose transferase-like glycosyltransferase